MSEELLSRLQKETGCDAVFGAMLLKFTGGDVDGAIQIMNSVDKNIYILKGKFIGQSSKIYGAFIIVFNIKLKMYHISEIVLVKDDKSGIEFDFSRTWRDYLNDLRLFKKRNVIDGDKCTKFIGFINLQKNIQNLEVKLLSKRENNEDELRGFLTDILINTMGDVNVALKLKIETTDVFELNKGIDSESVFSFDKEDIKEETDKEITDKKELIILKIEPEISPVTGVSISDLKKGDFIAVKIIDKRPIAEYISTLLHAIDSKNNEPITIFAFLKDVEVVEHGVFLTVEFGPGIYGSSYFGEDVKVNIKKDYIIDDKVQEEYIEKENIIMKYFWLFGGALFTIIMALFVLIFYYS